MMPARQEIMKILIAPDKFKGSLTGLEAAHSLEQGWRRARPGDDIRCLPVCDGGDGFGETLAHLEGASPRISRTTDASGQIIEASWWWHQAHSKAIIESATIIGLARLQPNRLHPFDLDTRGLGTVFSEAQDLGLTHCVVGIGGSATNDGGFGMARALGWEFIDSAGRRIEKWTQLDELEDLVPPAEQSPFQSLIIASDVANPLLGPQGASRIYGPQKGLLASDMEKAEACLGRLAQLLDSMRGHRWREAHGAGAAGGLGYGLMAFLGGVAESGFQYFAKLADLEKRILWADLVVTGEGSLDASTCMGKGVGELASICQRHRVPCVAAGGIVQTNETLSRLFKDIYSICPSLTDPDSSQKNPGFWLAELGEQIARRWTT